MGTTTYIFTEKYYVPINVPIICNDGLPMIVEYIALDKMLFFNKKVLIVFLFLHENICCGYSLEVPQRGTSNEYPQQMFSWRNKKNINLIATLI